MSEILKNSALSVADLEAIKVLNKAVPGFGAQVSTRTELGDLPFGEWLNAHLPTRSEKENFGSSSGGVYTPDPILVIDNELSGASISGNWDVTTPSDSTITVVSNKVRLHAPAGGDQRPSLVWNQNLFGVRPWYWRFYAKRLTTSNYGTLLSVGFRRTDGQTEIFTALALGTNMKKELWGVSTSGTNPQYIEIFLDECWIDVFWNARKLYVRRSSNAENDVPGHNDWTDVVSYDTHTVQRQIAPAEFVIELGKFNAITVEATYEISRLTLTDGGPPNAQ